jgi:exodeoxyribonuclease VII small subunit
MTADRPTFEARLARLDEIVRELEGDTVELARALQLFEEGVDCLRGASEELERAEAQVRTLTERADGTFGLAKPRVRGA